MWKVEGVHLKLWEATLALLYEEMSLYLIKDPSVKRLRSLARKTIRYQKPF